MKIRFPSQWGFAKQFAWVLAAVLTSFAGGYLTGRVPSSAPPGSQHRQFTTCVDRHDTSLERKLSSAEHTIDATASPNTLFLTARSNLRKGMTARSLVLFQALFRHHDATESLKCFAACYCAMLAAVQDDAFDESRWLHEAERLSNSCPSPQRLRDLIDVASRIVSVPKKAGLLQYVSTSASDDHVAPFPFEDLGTSYKKVSQASKEQADAQAAVSSEELDPIVALKKQIVAMSWHLLHAEWLSNPHVRRFEQANEHFQLGLQMLVDIEGELNDETDKKLSNDDFPIAAIHLDAVRLRKDTIEAKAVDAAKAVGKELRLLREIILQYRSVANDVMLASRDVQLEQHSSAQARLDQTRKRIKEIVSLREEWADVDKDIGLDPAFLLTAEPKGLLENEPEKAKPNPEVLSAFGDNFEMHVTVLQALSAFRAGDLQEASAILTESHDGPIASFVRASINEAIGTEIVASDPASAENRAKAAPYLARAKVAWQETVEGIKAFEQQNKFQQVVNQDAWKDALATTATIEQSLKWVAEDSPVDSADNTFRKKAEKRLRNMANPESYQKGVDAIASANDDVSIELLRDIQDSFRQGILRHDDKSLWRNYFMASLRVEGFKPKLLRQAEEVFNGDLSGNDADDFFVLGLLRLEGVRHAFRQEESQLFLPVDQGLNRQTLDTHRQKREQLQAEVARAVRELDRARQLFENKRLKPESIRCEAYRGLAQSLHWLLGISVDDQDKDNLHVLRDRNAHVIEALKFVYGKPSANIDDTEALIAALHAKGLLALLNADQDYAQSIQAGYAFAAANDLKMKLAYMPSDRYELGSVALGVLKQAADKQTVAKSYREERLNRLVLAQLTDGVALLHLGQPEIAQERIASAQESLKHHRLVEQHGRAGMVNSFWSLLGTLQAEENRTEEAVSIYHVLSYLQPRKGAGNSWLEQDGEVSMADAGKALALVVRMIHGKDDGKIVTMQSLESAIEKVNSPLLATALTLALEAKAAAHGLTPHTDRKQWLNLAVRAMEKAGRLNDERLVGFPLILQLQSDSAKRLQSPDWCLQEATVQEQRYELPEAITTLRSGLRRHPDDQELWSRLIDVHLLQSSLAESGVAKTETKEGCLADARLVLEYWRAHVAVPDAGQLLAAGKLHLRNDAWNEALAAFDAARSRFNEEEDPELRHNVVLSQINTRLKRLQRER